MIIEVLFVLTDLGAVKTLINPCHHLLSFLIHIKVPLDTAATLATVILFVGVVRVPLSVSYGPLGVGVDHLIYKMFW